MNSWTAASATQSGRPLPDVRLTQPRDMRTRHRPSASCSCSNASKISPSTSFEPTKSESISMPARIAAGFSARYITPAPRVAAACSAAFCFAAACCCFAYISVRSASIAAHFALYGSNTSYPSFRQRTRPIARTVADRGACVTRASSPNQSPAPYDATFSPLMYAAHLPVSTKYIESPFSPWRIMIPDPDTSVLSSCSAILSRSLGFSG